MRPGTESLARRDSESYCPGNLSDLARILSGLRGEILVQTLWRGFKDEAGIDKRHFFQYFGDEEKGFAMRIGSVTVFDKFVVPGDLNWDFVPPQSFCYVEGAQQETMERLGGL